MTSAYDNAYLRQARASLARAFDYAVNVEGCELEHFCAMFINTGIAHRFQRGDAHTLAGQSGVELAREVLACQPDYKPRPARYELDRSPEYWTGWALAHYQWKSALPFERIFRAVSVGQMLTMYQMYHEMDISQFIDNMDALIRKAESISRLKELRLRAGMSQRQVAESSGVPLRSVQQYEQRQKSINRASFDTVIALAKAVYCSDPTELMEID